MSAATPKSLFARGLRDSLPFTLVAAPFAMAFGVLATEAGLNVLETLSFSVVVIAGAAQLTALALMQDNAPTIIILISALAVNLRMAMYSAALTPHLGPCPFWQRAFASYLLMDQPVAMGLTTFETQPDMTPAQKMGYYLGSAMQIAGVWYVFTLLGAWLGTGLPESWALDFAVPLAFIAIIAPGLRSLAHVAAALVAIVLSLLLAGLPYSLGLLLAGLAGMVTGAQTERWMEARR